MTSLWLAVLIAAAPGVDPPLRGAALAVRVRVAPSVRVETTGGAVTVGAPAPGSPPPRITHERNADGVRVAIDF